MGNFIAISAVVNAGPASTLEVVREFVASGRLMQQLSKRDKGLIHPCGQNVAVLYPSAFVQWDELSQLISSTLSTAVFSFHLHEDDLWMFALFQNGQRVAQFNTIPDYWGAGTQDIVVAWTANPAVVAACAGVSIDLVYPYLVHWSKRDIQSVSVRARPVDRFARGDAWQMTDFMRVLGFEYPVPEDGNTMGQRFHMNH